MTSTLTNLEGENPTKDGHSKSSSMVEKFARRAGKKHNEQGYCQAIPIDVLSDDVLLLIFKFYMTKDFGIYLFYPKKKMIEVWQTLVHVCRRWRSIVFGSPRFLNLRLACMDKMPVGKIDVWPPLPVVISGDNLSTSDLDNIIAALKHNDRICDISVNHYSSPQLEKVVAAMQQPFPALTILKLRLSSDDALAIPDSFLGGSAPCLQELELQGILYPALPKLLLSATNLSTLSLLDTPHTGYISPEEMVISLSTLTSLQDLSLEFPSSHPSQTSQHSPPPTRVALPALSHLWIAGLSGCLEGLVARIDAPLLNWFYLSFSDEVPFDTPQIVQFIGHTPMLKALDEVQVIFDCFDLEFRLPLPTLTRFDDTELELGASYSISYEQFSTLAQAHSSSLFPVSTVKNLYIRETDDPAMCWDGDVEDARWLLRPFTSVTTLYVSETLWPRFKRALRDHERNRATDILPALQNVEHYWR